MAPLLVSSLFLIFVQFWAPNNPKLDFTIHGLWPEYPNNTYPEYCNKSAQFNLSQIEYLIPILNIEWPSSDGPNQDFWKHEYLKHATCYPGVDEEQFFLDTLHLFDQTDSTQTFRENKIKTDVIYSKEKLNQMFNGTFHCQGSQNATTSPTTTRPAGLNSSIATLWRCYDLNLQKFDCPNWIDTSCTANVLFETESQIDYYQQN